MPESTSSLFGFNLKFYHEDNLQDKLIQFGLSRKRSLK
uniref:Uncharacterized protein n=1 Tax=Tetranychus urticae TaxID=32264 RepID=T1KHC2_TETUR